MTINLILNHIFNFLNTTKAQLHFLQLINNQKIKEMIISAIMNDKIDIGIHSKLKNTTVFNKIFALSSEWSIEFLNNILQPEHTDQWDLISCWWNLPEWFCEENIEWLNFHDLLYYQSNLSKDFFLKHLDRIDWIIPSSSSLSISSIPILESDYGEFEPNDDKKIKYIDRVFKGA